MSEQIQKQPIRSVTDEAFNDSAVAPKCNVKSRMKELLKNRKIASQMYYLSS